MRKIFISIICLVFVKGCAKPEVVNIKQPNDYNLDCNGLEISIEEAQKLKKDANYAKSGTGGNVSRLILFWPAWAQSLHNADKAIIAAEDRIFHLKKIMKDKNCKNITTFNANTGENNLSSQSIAGQLKALRDLRESGDLTEDEFQKAKDKILK
tara:strand:+ start:636 stop:1097 length:462 start_codon:yes stop_codon:yes gene_type:complete